jgi:hypothetical protein
MLCPVKDTMKLVRAEDKLNQKYTSVGLKRGGGGVGGSDNPLIREFQQDNEVRRRRRT